jgi:hypothetical protein
VDWQPCMVDIVILISYVTVVSELFKLLRLDVSDGVCFHRKRKFYVLKNIRNINVDTYSTFPVKFNCL